MCDKKLKKCIFFGISKFSKISLFSALNNLKDISNKYEWADLIGITEEEARNNKDVMKYVEFIIKKYELETKNTMTAEKFWEIITKHYDGYRFVCESDKKALSPYSFMNFLDDSVKEKTLTRKNKLKMDNYWWESGGSSAISLLLKKVGRKTIEILLVEAENKIKGFPPKGLLKVEKTKLEKSCLPLVFSGMHLLQLYQTGYLTLHKLDDDEEYILEFPNLEVAVAFKELLVEEWNEIYSSDFKIAIKNGEYDKFFDCIEDFFKKIDKPMNENESSYQSMLYAAMKKDVKIGELCVVEHWIGKSARIDTILAFKSPIECVNLIEYKISTGDMKGSPINREYIKKAKENMTFQRELREKGLVNPIYRTFFIIFEGNNIKEMVVHQQGHDDNSPIEVFRQEKEKSKPEK